MSNPSLPQGTRDFGPDIVRRRNYILSTIRNVFELYGFQPLETPAIENLDTLMGKYGEEGDKLIFKILNNGLDNPSKEKQVKEGFENILAGKNSKSITERALKYDLTIPFARYVAMNHGKLNFPFKRYQVQPVWRADRPQKGRYREFFQCDADVVGSLSRWNEIELILIYARVFEKLGMNGYAIHINHRGLLAALAEFTGQPEKMTDITVAMDKLDKIGIEKVQEELVEKGLEEHGWNIVKQYLELSGDNNELIQKLRELMGPSNAGTKGVEDLEFITGSRHLENVNLVIDPSLARGLNYYTGVILEVKAPPSVKMGSIGGGGRYDDLTGLFGVPGIAGVGISFGVDRIYDVMEELNLFPETVETGTRVLFFNLGKHEAEKSFELVQALREKGIAAELYHESVKMDKQFKYADQRNIPFVAIIGSRELEQGTCTIKNLKSGEQQQVKMEEVSEWGFEG